jgi:Fe-S-cluster containining protein
VEESLTKSQDCKQCGRCCEKWGWGQKGTVGDIRPWIADRRTDILRHVAVRFADETRCAGTEVSADDLPRVTRIDFWVDENGRALRHCPFFFRADDGKAYCRIHGAKPKICTSFTPWNEGIRDYALNCSACRETSP